jgi:hypothetical protein
MPFLYGSGFRIERSRHTWPTRAASGDPWARNPTDVLRRRPPGGITDQISRSCFLRDAIADADDLQPRSRYHAGDSWRQRGAWTEGVGPESLKSRRATIGCHRIGVDVDNCRSPVPPHCSAIGLDVLARLGCLFTETWLTIQSIRRHPRLGVALRERSSAARRGYDWDPDRDLGKAIASQMRRPGLLTRLLEMTPPAIGVPG